MVPKKVMGKDMPPETFVDDEGINPALNAKTLSLYPTVFKDKGTVTPGNACPISDGAAAVLVATKEKAQSLGLEILGVIRGYGFAGVEPERMGIGPVCAVPIALKRAKAELKDMQLIEINEAFAAQYLAVEKSLGLDRDLVNVNGILDTKNTVNNTINVAGNWNVASFDARAGKVIFDANTTGKTITSNSQSFYDIEFNNAAGDWQLQDTLTVTNDFTVTNSATSGAGVDLNGKAVNITGNFTMSSGEVTGGLLPLQRVAIGPIGQLRRSTMTRAKWI